MNYSWILDSGGAGRGAWQGGVLYELMRWCRENECFPSITMGSSAGGYAAADVATGTERTVMKGWTAWGKEEQLRRPGGQASESGKKESGFRHHLRASISYVMQEEEVESIFNGRPDSKLIVFTTRVRRKDGARFGKTDSFRYLWKTATRKLPKALKYLPGRYVEDPVIFATKLPEELQSEHVRPLTRKNYHRVIEASCLVPIAMGDPLEPEAVSESCRETDSGAVFLDGSYSLKMPMGLFDEDARFRPLAAFTAAERTVVFCCDPGGSLWESSMRLRSLNSLPGVRQALEESRLLVLYPDHKVEAGFLCTDNAVIMRTFDRGREQGRRLLKSEKVLGFFGKG
jgi:predicted acylesterase/phospholipase RssA